MKLILQIALGVFLGSFCSLAAIELWRDHKAQMAARLVQEETERQQQAALAARKIIADQFRKKQQEDADRQKSDTDADPGATLGLPPGMPVPENARK